MPEPPGHVAVLVHEAARTGPPVVLLHFLRRLQEEHGTEYSILLLEGGPLVPEFEAVGSVELLDLVPGVELTREIEDQYAQRQSIRDAGTRPDAVLVNTAISIHGLRVLPASWGPVITIVHELEIGLRNHLRRTDLRLMLERTHHFIAGAGCVAANLTTRHGVPGDRISVGHEFVDVDAVQSPPRTPTAELRRRLAIPEGAKVVGASGVLHWRKAPDLFLDVVETVVRRGQPSPVFVWVGGPDEGAMWEQVTFDVKARGLGEHVRFVGEQPEPFDHYRLFDLFLLPSREDAFPLVCLEAAALGVPVVCFDTGGMPEFVRDDAGVVIPYPEVEAMADAIESLLADDDHRARLGAAAATRARRDHDVAPGAARWTEILAARAAQSR